VRIGAVRAWGAVVWVILPATAHSKNPPNDRPTDRPTERPTDRTTDRTTAPQVPFRTGERIAFSYLISQKYVGDEAELEVLRDGKVLSTRAK